MNNNALISIKSKQNVDDTIELQTPGTLQKGDNCFIVKYEETEISGMEGSVTTLNIYDNNLELKRDGTVTTLMKFKENERFDSIYSTEHGVIDIIIKTEKLNIKKLENEINVNINYWLFLSNQRPKKTDLNINVKFNSIM